MKLLILLTAAGGLLHGEVLYRVRLSAAESGRVVQLPAEQYVAAVLAGEVASFRNDEALKAMAVAARTYAAHFHSRHANEGFDFCSTTHCQRAILRDVTARLQKAAEATRAQLLWFHSQPALAMYTQNCGGSSEALQPEGASYLMVHADPYCPRTAWTWDVGAERLEQALRGAGMQVPTQLQQVVVREQTASGRVHALSLAGVNGSQVISAGSFRLAMGRTLGWNTLRSDQYQVRSANGRIHFEGRGQGHGIGLCQQGADEMAGQGKTYREILSFYYPATTVSVLAHDVSWIGARDVAFASTQSVANATLKMTGEVAGELHTTYGFSQPSGLEIYVYPDMETYRNGTGEPGWVAAHTQGNRVETQPIDLLEKHGGFRSVLRHELLHVMVENAARPGLPLWFREGLVECLAGDPLSKSDVKADERRLAVRDDNQRTRAAYAAAALRVQQLLTHYGIAEVLFWVRDGLPDAVTHSSTNNNPVNKR